MAEATYKRPLPRRRGMAADFYQFCKQHELCFQRCTDCSTWRHVPRDMCAKCGSFNWEWAKSSGKGKLFSWATGRQPMLPQFADLVAYSPVVLEMDEGVRPGSWGIDVPPERLRLGLPGGVGLGDV